MKKLSKVLLKLMGLLLVKNNFSMMEVKTDNILNSNKYDKYQNFLQQDGDTTQTNEQDIKNFSLLLGAIILLYQKIHSNQNLQLHSNTLKLETIIDEKIIDENNINLLTQEAKDVSKDDQLHSNTLTSETIIDENNINPLTQKAKDVSEDDLSIKLEESNLKIINNILNQQDGFNNDNNKIINNEENLEENLDKNLQENIITPILNYYIALNPDEKHFLQYNKLSSNSIRDFNPFMLNINFKFDTEKKVINYLSAFKSFIININELSSKQQCEYFFENMHDSGSDRTQIQYLISAFLSPFKHFDILNDMKKNSERNLDLIFDFFSSNLEISLNFFTLYAALGKYHYRSYDINRIINFIIKKNINNKDFLNKYNDFIVSYLTVFSSEKNFKTYLNKIINLTKDSEDFIRHNFVRSLSNFFEGNQNFLQVPDLIKIFSKEELKGLNINIEEMTKEYIKKQEERKEQKRLEQIEEKNQLLNNIKRGLSIYKNNLVIKNDKLIQQSINLSLDEFINNFKQLNNEQRKNIINEAEIFNNTDMQYKKMYWVLSNDGKFYHLYNFNNDGILRRDLGFTISFEDMSLFL